MKVFPTVLGLLLAIPSALAIGVDDTPVARGDREGVFLVSVGPEPQTLDPQRAAGQLEAGILRALGEGLVNLDAEHDLRPVPGAAESWNVSPDGLVYTFHLREGLRWSDGRPLTAANFAHGLRRLLTPGTGANLGSQLWCIRGAEAFNQGHTTDFATVGIHALDDRTLTITLVHPTPYLLALLAQRLAYPARADDDPPAEQRARPGHVEGFFGNGPFRLTAWNAQRELVVQPNPFYWNAAAVRLKEIRFVILEDLDTEERAFRAGLVHKTARLPAGKVDVYRRDDPASLRVDPVLGTYFFYLNITRPPLDDPRVRRALALALDRDSLVKNVTRAGQLPAWSFTPPDLAGYTARAGLPFDPEAARRLLADAGHPGGRGLPPVEILFNTNDNHRLIAEAVQAMWKRELGVDARLVNREWKVYLDELARGNFQAARAGWTASYADPHAFLELFLTGGANNRTGFADPAYDALVSRAAGERDPDARRELFQRAEQRLVEAAPLVPVFHYTQPYLLRPSVHGWRGNALDYHLYQNITLEP